MACRSRKYNGLIRKLEETRTRSETGQSLVPRGTRSERSAQAGLSGCCITHNGDYVLVCRIPRGPLRGSGGAKSSRSRFQTLVQANFSMISTSSSDWCGRSIGVPIRSQAAPALQSLLDAEVEPSCSDREKRGNVNSNSNNNGGDGDGHPCTGPPEPRPKANCK